MGSMKPNFACLSLVAFAFTSCDKSETKPKPDDASSQKPRMETRAEAPAITRKIAPARRESSPAGINQTIDQPLSHPVDASMIRPAGTAPDDASWDTLTAGQKIEKFTSSGIARMPRYASDMILADATKAGEAENQVLFITEQSAAWHHINAFKESDTGMPDHMKMALLERLSRKHGLHGST
jgi:hypothetical protein